MNPPYAALARGDTFGIQIQTNSFLTKSAEDWSQVRSPARARRRMKRGFPQRIRHLTVPDDRIIRMGNTLVMHPATYEAFKAAVERRQSDPRPESMPVAEVPDGSPSPMWSMAPMFAPLLRRWPVVVLEFP